MECDSLNTAQMRSNKEDFYKKGVYHPYVYGCFLRVSSSPKQQWLENVSPSVASFQLLPDLFYPYKHHCTYVV